MAPRRRYPTPKELAWANDDPLDGVPVVSTVPTPAPTDCGLLLRLKKDGSEGAYLPLTGDDVSIGRDRDCDIRLKPMSVSQRHAMLALDENGCWVLKHLSSTNPTLVNGECVEDALTLQDGDRFQIGNQDFVFYSAKNGTAATTANMVIKHVLQEKSMNTSEDENKREPYKFNKFNGCGDGDLRTKAAPRDCPSGLRKCYTCEKPLACEDPNCKERVVTGGHPCCGLKAVMLQCVCDDAVALCVSCARKQIADALEATYLGYHDAAVACPQCKAAPICFTGDAVDKPRYNYNVDAVSLAEVDRQLEALVDKALSRCDGGARRGARLKKSSATYYTPALDHFRDKFCLLWDVRDPAATDSVDFFRLALARAETYLQENPICEGRHHSVSLHDLPLGPLEALRFVEHRMLDAYLHGQPVSNVCSSCSDDIAPGNTAFSMCNCRARTCGSCAISLLRNTGADCPYNAYLDKCHDKPADDHTLRKDANDRLIAGFSCPICRVKTYAVSGIEEARKEDRRLLEEALKAFGKPVDKENEGGVNVYKALRWIKHKDPNDDSGNFIYQFVSDKRWQNEGLENLMREYKEQLIELSKTHVRHVQREVARLWATLSCPDKGEVALGPLSKLKTMRDAVFDAILRSEQVLQAPVSDSDAGSGVDADTRSGKVPTADGGVDGVDDDADEQPRQRPAVVRIGPAAEASSSSQSHVDAALERVPAADAPPSTAALTAGSSTCSTRGAPSRATLPTGPPDDTAGHVFSDDTGARPSARPGPGCCAETGGGLPLTQAAPAAAGGDGDGDGAAPGTRKRACAAKDGVDGVDDDADEQPRQRPAVVRIGPAAEASSSSQSHVDAPQPKGAAREREPAAEAAPAPQPAPAPPPPRASNEKIEQRLKSAMNGKASESAVVAILAELPAAINDYRQSMVMSPFDYVDDNETPQFLKYNPVEQLHRISRKVLHTWLNRAAAVKAMGISLRGISRCLLGGQWEYEGFRWRYYDGPPINWDDEAFQARQVPVDELKQMQAAEEARRRELVRQEEDRSAGVNAPSWSSSYKPGGYFRPPQIAPAVKTATSKYESSQRQKDNYTKHILPALKHCKESGWDLNKLNDANAFVVPKGDPAWPSGTGGVNVGIYVIRIRRGLILVDFHEDLAELGITYTKGGLEAIGEYREIMAMPPFVQRDEQAAAKLTWKPNSMDLLLKAAVSRHSDSGGTISWSDVRNDIDFAALYPGLKNQQLAHEWFKLRRKFHNAGMMSFITVK